MMIQCVLPYGATVMMIGDDRWLGLVIVICGDDSDAMRWYLMKLWYDGMWLWYVVMICAHDV